MTLISEAADCAAQLHHGQTRKYTGEPYIVHPAEVATIVRGIGLSNKATAAAWLHDTLEDTGADEADIREAFGEKVFEMVYMLSDFEEGNRATRKAAARERLSKASGVVKSIKLADLISNTRSIVEHDPKFAKVYLQEKRELLKVLQWGGSDVLLAIAKHGLETGEAQLKELKCP